MDGLSSAASVFAAASLAIQLAESLNKFCTFWKSIKEAPEDVRAIAEHLELLSSILTGIAREAQRVEPDASLTAVLNHCNVHVKRLASLLADLEPGLSSKSTPAGKWASFKAVLKSEKVKKIEDILEKLKSTLILAQQRQEK